MPSKKIEALLDLEASAQADIDEQYESKAELAADRIDEILRFPGERDREIFELIGASPDDPFDAFFDVPGLERDLLWQGALSSLVVAARMQAWIEIFGVDAIEMFEQNGQKINELRQNMSQAEIKEAALKGIGKARINGEKDRRASQRNNRKG